jgi:hypothetical protein
MTPSIDEFVRLTQRTQDALAAAVRAWQETARTALDAPEGGRMPDVRTTVDAAFTFASRVLADQLEFAQALLAVATPQAGPAAAQGRSPAPPSPSPTSGAAVPASPAAALPAAAPTREARPSTPEAVERPGEAARETPPSSAPATPPSSGDEPPARTAAAASTAPAKAAPAKAPAAKRAAKTAPAKRTAKATPEKRTRAATPAKRTPRASGTAHTPDEQASPAPSRDSETPPAEPSGDGA